MRQVYLWYISELVVSFVVVRTRGSLRLILWCLRMSLWVYPVKKGIDSTWFDILKVIPNSHAGAGFEIETLEFPARFSQVCAPSLVDSFFLPLIRLNNCLNLQCFSNFKRRKIEEFMLSPWWREGDNRFSPLSPGSKFALVLHMKHPKPTKVKRFAWGHHEVRKPAYLSIFPFCLVALKYNSIACKIRKLN